MCPTEGRADSRGMIAGSVGGGAGAEAFLEIHMHFQKQTEVKINPGDFVGMEAWELGSSLPGQTQVGINRAVGVASAPPPQISVPSGGALQQIWEAGNIKSQETLKEGRYGLWGLETCLFPAAPGCSPFIWLLPAQAQQPLPSLMAVSQFLASQPLTAVQSQANCLPPLCSSLPVPPAPRPMGRAGLGEFFPVLLVFSSLSGSCGSCPVLGSRVPDLIMPNVTVGL